MQSAAKQRMVIGYQDFVCGHWLNDPVFMAALMVQGSPIHKATAWQLSPQGLLNVKST